MRDDKKGRFGVRYYDVAKRKNVSEYYTNAYERDRRFSDLEEKSYAYRKVSNTDRY